MKITKPKWLKNFIIRYNNIDKSNRFFVNVGFVWTAVVLFLFVPNTLIDVYVSENGNLVNISGFNIRKPCNFTNGCPSSLQITLIDCAMRCHHC